MGLQRVFGILFLVVGVLGLAYGGFSYTKETHKVSIGSLQLSVDEKKTVNIPLSVGIAFMLVGGALLLIPRKQ
jgi:TRAP-type C4-dicarboxylate transport system permease small subunit